MGNAEEGTFTAPDGKEIYTKTWKSTFEPIAALVFLHGFSDHVNRYEALFSNFTDVGIIVYAFDQRGWGRTVRRPSEKGLTGPTALVMEDITAFLRSHLPSKVPLFMMGHSMGGQETLYFMATGPEELKKQISGFILSAPFIALTPGTEPGWFKLAALRLAGTLFPNQQIANKLDCDLISKDPAFNKECADDALNHGTGTLEGLSGLLDRSNDLHKGLVTIKDWEGLHVLFLHGTADRITSHKASEDFVKRLDVKNKKLKLFDGAYHSIFAEPTQKQEFIADVIGFIETRSNSALEGCSKL